MVKHPNFEKLSPAVKKKISEGKAWCFEDLKIYVTMVEERPTSRLNQRVESNNEEAGEKVDGAIVNDNKQGRAEKKDEEVERKMREKDEEIAILRESLDSEKQLVLKLLDGKEGDKERTDSSGNSKDAAWREIIQENQKLLKLNSKKIEKL